MVKHVILTDFPSVDDDIESEQFCELGPTEQVERVDEVDGAERKPLRSLRKCKLQMARGVARYVFGGVLHDWLAGRQSNTSRSWSFFLATQKIPMV